MTGKPGKAAAVKRVAIAERARLLFTLELLLIAVVVLSMTFPGVDNPDRSAILAGALFYSAFVLAARQLRRLGVGSLWTFGVQTLAMVPFVTWSMWFTDKLESPLRTGFLLAIVASALTQNMRAAMLHTALIAAGFVVLDEPRSLEPLLSPGYASSLLTRVAPLIVVAYVSSVYASLFRFDMNRGMLDKAIDPQTGLKDLAGFAIVADRLLTSAERRGNPAALLLIAVDNLPAITAGHGPEGAAHVLRELAERLSAAMRHNDLAARCADNEFVVLLPDTPLAGARELVQRIRQRLDAGGIEFGGTPITPQLSAGLVERGSAHVSLAEMLEHADHALASERQHVGSQAAVSHN